MRSLRKSNDDGCTSSINNATQDTGINSGAQFSVPNDAPIYRRRHLMGVAKVSACLLTLFLAIANSHPKAAWYLNASCWAAPTAKRQAQTISIKNAIGVITLNKENYSRKSMIQLFNKDDSLWYEFSFYENEGDRKFDQANAEFRPFAFHPDYFLLVLKCIGTDATRFEVVVNETTRLTKFVRKNDNTLRFETWESHILNLFAVGFNQSKNPLLDAPAKRAKQVRAPKGAIFHPVEIKGEWLRVRWNISEEITDASEKIGYGWIKWKEDNNILIEFFYFS